MKNLLSDQAVRGWIYRVETALVPLLIAYGVATEQTISLWLGLVGAAFGLGLAAANTSTKRD